MTGIVITLVFLSVLIVLHELSHFATAKLFGMQTPVFRSGPALWTKRKIGQILGHAVSHSFAVFWQLCDHSRT